MTWIPHTRAIEDDCKRMLSDENISGKKSERRAVKPDAKLSDHY
jgi:hypothetical protein